MSKRLVGNIGYVSTKVLYEIHSGYPKIVAQGQGYNVGEKPTVIFYTYAEVLPPRRNTKTGYKCNFTVRIMAMGISPILCC